MILHAARIVKSKHAKDAFSGQGAKQFGGRWNSPGSPVVYAAGSLSLALLEMIVHLQSKDILAAYVSFTIAFDSSLVAPAPSLPANWRKSPAPKATQTLGDKWLASGSHPVLTIPSVIVPSESNYLLNPAHPDFHKIKIGHAQRIKFDPRLIKA